MANRIVYGNTHSSNGWPMVDQGSCTWVDIPGTNPTVRIQIQNGQPLQILRAFVADINAYVEHVTDNDTACYTETNSVGSSNHLSASAVDVDWDRHPFRVADAGWNPDQIRTIRQIQDFYEGTVFWGNDWSDPKDAMHFQLASLANGGDINTFNNPHTQDFINRKIRADAFSTFRRDGVPVPPPPPPTLSRQDRYALLIIAEGQRRGISPKGIQIALATGLVESNITVYANSKVPASMAIPHDAVGSDGYSVGIFQQQVRDTGNGWWWGDAATCMDPTSSAGLFYGRLANLAYNGTSKSPGGFAQQIQQSAFPDRYDQRFGEAVTLYNRLVTITAPPPTGDGFLMALSDQQQRELYDAVCGQRPSKSPLRPLAQGGNSIGNLRDVVGYVDGSEHWQAVKAAAELGHPTYLALLQEVANADPARYPDRQDDSKLAQAILADIEAKNAEPQAVSNNVVLNAPAPPRATEVVYRDVPQPVTATLEQTSSTTGDLIGRAYDALDDLRLADALPIEGRAPLAALVAVLNTKNGSQV